MHKDISIWMPLYIGDLQAKFARMTAEQIGAALLLMMDFWKNGAIPHDLATVCSIMKLPQHTKAKTLLNTLIALELFEVESEQIHSNFLSSLKSQALQNQQMKSDKAKNGGKRDLATVQRLKARLKKLGVQYAGIASDHWDSFITAFQCCKQVIGKFFTVGIEGNNCRIRHRIRRGFRRSCNFSKKLENHFKAFDLTFFYLNNGFV
ncbi:IS1 family transposase [Acinetobacter baumannii]|uniref:IS1 family transposase n=1 Tax=Acinetobacter baumannii TaxID=470 RepID=UPI00385DBA8C